MVDYLIGDDGVLKELIHRHMKLVCNFAYRFAESNTEFITSKTTLAP